jgi:CRP-like cAMP-binding protein
MDTRNCGHGNRRTNRLEHGLLFLTAVLTCISGETRDMASHAAAKLGPAHLQSSAAAVPRLFDGVGKGDIAAIIAAAVVRKFPSRQAIVRADDPATHLFVLKTGSVDLYRSTSEGQNILIIRFSPGDTFGLASVLARPMGYLGTAEVVQESELYVWEHSSLRHFARKHPTLAENLMRIGLEYIRIYSDRHLALVSDNTEDRLRRTLSELEVRAGHRQAKGLEVEITNERLASLADIGYYTTSRLLNKWQRKGAIEKSRGKVLVVSPEGMLDRPDARVLHRART